MAKRYKLSLLAEKGCDERFFDDYDLALKFAARSVESGTYRHVFVTDEVEDRLLVWYAGKKCFKDIDDV